MYANAPKKMQKGVWCMGPPRDIGTYTWRQTDRDTPRIQLTVVQFLASAGTYLFYPKPPFAKRTANAKGPRSRDNKVVAYWAHCSVIKTRCTKAFSSFSLLFSLHPQLHLSAVSTNKSFEQSLPSLSSFFLVQPFFFFFLHFCLLTLSGQRWFSYLYNSRKTPKTSTLRAFGPSS